MTTPVLSIDLIGGYRETEHRSGVREVTEGEELEGYLLEGTLALEVEGRRSGSVTSSSSSRSAPQCHERGTTKAKPIVSWIVQSFCQEHRTLRRSGRRLSRATESDDVPCGAAVSRTLEPGKPSLVQVR